MGTNYYLESYPRPPCDKCGRPYEQERKHIGKSSAGWVFALHVYPEEGINDLPDWWDRWNMPGAIIKDEYGKTVSPNEMLACVLARFGARNRPDQDDAWYAVNQAQRGPYGLARARIDGRRVLGWGNGTYALHTGGEDSW